MKARTELLMYLLLWGLDEIINPTFRNMTDSFEQWAYRNRIYWEIQELERRKFLERLPGNAAEAIYRLSARGRLVALGGRDPQTEWRRSWDGTWRVVIYDVPQKNCKARAKLRRFLKESRFGYLQNSVWISPDPLDKVAKKLSAESRNVESLITLQGSPAAGESNAAIVQGAWNFERINSLYDHSLGILESFSEVANPAKAPAALHEWALAEREAWKVAASADPFLPETLLPADYIGKKAWTERKQVLSRAAQWIMERE